LFYRFSFFSILKKSVIYKKIRLKKRRMSAVPL